MTIIRMIVSELAEVTPVFGQKYKINEIHAQFDMQQLGGERLNTPTNEMIAYGRLAGSAAARDPFGGYNEMIAYGRLAGMIGDEVMKYVKLEKYRSPYGNVMRASVKVVDENE